MTTITHDRPRPLLQFFMWTVMLPVGSVMLVVWYVAQAAQTAATAAPQLLRHTSRSDAG